MAQRKKRLTSGSSKAARSETRFETRFRVWLEVDGEPFLGAGRAALLRAVARNGSISAAAREIGMSYHKAWKLMDSMNRALPNPVTEMSKGGSKGGGAALTALGEKLLVEFEQLEARMRERCLQLQPRFDFIARRTGMTEHGAPRGTRKAPRGKK